MKIYRLTSTVDTLKVIFSNIELNHFELCIWFSYSFGLVYLLYFPMSVLNLVLRLFGLHDPVRRHEGGPWYNSVVNRLMGGQQREGSTVKAFTARGESEAQRKIMVPIKPFLICERAPLRRVVSLTPGDSSDTRCSAGAPLLHS